MKNPLQLLFVILITSLIVFSCKPSKEETDDLVTADRKPMVTYLGNNIIVPRYQALNDAVKAFDAQVQIFTSSPSSESLIDLRTKFYASYVAWEYVASFEFGPATGSSVNLGTKLINAFPTDTTLIKNKINQNLTSIPVSSGSSYSGFPAIDYLLFWKNLSTQQIVDSFQVSILASKRCNFLKILSSNLKTRINTTYSEWTSGSTPFNVLYSNNTGLDLGSSTSQTINMMVADLENIKNFKIGLPINVSQNVVIDNENVYPFRCEGYHSDSSLVLAKASMEAFRRLFKGVSPSGIDGSGFDDYLVSIGREGLSKQIEDKIELIQTKLDLIQNPISIAIQTPAGKQAVKNVYQEMLDLITLMKVDFPSAVGVIISYGDTDGD